MNDTNVKLVHRMYEIAAAGELDALHEVIDDDVVFHVPGRSRNTGSHRGVAGVQAFLLEAAQVAGGTLRTELHRVLADDEWAVALATYRASRPDRPDLENNLAHVLRVRDGKVVEGWFHSRNQYEVDAFWGEHDD